ncbi:LOW QUALITY PROTEIN: folliculin-interacting protein 2 [Aphomia sociella]
MALFDKIFPIKRKLDNSTRGQQNANRSSQNNQEQVRLLLFKECDWRGRKLLFDSSTIDKIPAGKNDKPNIRQAGDAPCILEVSEGFAYVYKGPAADASVLGEMIFGAVAMNYKSVSLKVHIMDEPRRLMCTKVFCIPTTRRISRTERRTDTGSSEVRNGSMPLNVPLLNEEGVSLSFSLDRGDSGYYGDHSPYSSVGSTYDYVSMFDTLDGNNTQDDFYTFHSPPGRKLSISSNGSWQRRTFQNIATRFDLGQQSTNFLNLPTATSNTTSSDSQVYTNSSASGTSDSLASTGSSMAQKKIKLGLALLFTVTDATEMDLVRRCAEHSPQLQALVCRLRLATLTAGSGGGFVSTLQRAATDATRWLTDLMNGPRIQPVWLSLVTSDSRTANKTAETLLSSLCSVLSIGDTKHTNFFISTLLTHVLTYHLGWVTTVSPYDTVNMQSQPIRTSDSQRPYNVLWAQLSDLCGSIVPPRAARTIISGTTNSQFVNRLLIVLTYFVRCGDVRRNDFQFESCVLLENKVVSVNAECSDFKSTASKENNPQDTVSKDSLKLPTVNTQNSDSSSMSTLVASQTSIKRSSTMANVCQKLSNSSEFAVEDCSSASVNNTACALRRNPTMMMPLRNSSDSSLNSSNPEDSEAEKVVFVLGEDEKLVGLKNKSNGGKSVKKSSKVHNEPIFLEVNEEKESNTKDISKHQKNSESPSKCCGQTLQHSKPIKHSGFKFEFDKYPQIVTNYMKSKNLEILDRHYIGKPGNLKLDNFQFDPTIVPPIQEERCETCYKCQLMESMLQTPTNASEMEYMNDIPRQSEPQYAKETVVNDVDTFCEVSKVNFVRKRKENTLVVNPVEKRNLSEKVRKPTRVKEKDKMMKVKQVIEFPLPTLQLRSQPERVMSGFDASLLGGVTDHYVPDLILQGTIAKSNTWETDLRRDLDLTSYLNKIHESPLQTVAIIGDTNKWEVRVLGRDHSAGGPGGGGGGWGRGGMSSLVGAMLDALPAMHRARVPAHQCLTFLEGKLREFCVLSKTLADMLMSTDFCDIATLTKSLNIDVNDVPLLLAVATTHTPQVAARYGISYR